MQQTEVLELMWTSKVRTEEHILMSTNTCCAVCHSCLRTSLTLQYRILRALQDRNV